MARYRTTADRRTGAPLTRADVAKLRAAATRFGDDARRAKADLLASLRKRGLVRPRVLLDYHDALLFVAAHPDDAAIAALAVRELARCAEAARAVAAAASGKAALRGSGIAWSDVSAALTYDIARWLARRFPGEAEIASFGDGEAALEQVLGLLLPAVEADSIASGDSGVALLDRLKGRGGSRLAFLVAHVDRLPVAPAVRAHLYESLTPFVTIAPRGTWASRTFTRGLPTTPFWQREPLAKALPDARGVIERPLPHPRALAARDRLALVDAARATLAVLARETDPITWPSTAAVTLLELERGFAVALYPTHASRRPALDSHTGYLLFRNGVPVAYGGGWPFLGVCRIGINVFPAFRGGESSLAFAQVLRVYRQWFRSDRFVVEPYQFGAGNPEGLRSGAFWFYWRLGFRPVDRAIERRAAKEFARLARSKGDRTPLPLMRELTAADVALDLAPLPAEQRVEPAELSIAVSHWIATVHAGDRHAAADDAHARACAALGVSGERAWPLAERESFRSLALVVGLIDGVDRWSKADKAACIALMRAKGADDDRPYFLQLAGHPCLPAALLRIASGAK